MMRRRQPVRTAVTRCSTKDRAAPCKTAKDTEDAPSPAVERLDVRPAPIALSPAVRKKEWRSASPQVSDVTATQTVMGGKTK